RLREMSKSDEKASEGGRDDPAPASVLDFLYHDAQRVGSFLAQFDPFGHLTGIKHIEGVETASADRTGANTGANLAVVRGGASFEGQRSAAEREGAERAYDPLWTNVIELLHLLEDKRLIERDLTRARMGQFVLVSGDLAVLDFAMIKMIWENEALRGQVEKTIATSVQGGHL